MLGILDNECLTSSSHGLGRMLLSLSVSPLPVSQPTNNKLKSPRTPRPGPVDFHLQAALFALLQDNLLVAKRRNASVDGIGRSFGNSSQPRAEYKDRLAAGATHKTGSVNLPRFDCVTDSPPCWPLRHLNQNELLVSSSAINAVFPGFFRLALLNRIPASGPFLQKRRVATQKSGGLLRRQRGSFT